jgi:8-oxo-dGTP diphosphatase
MRTEIKILVKSAIYHKGKVLLVRRHKDDGLGGYWEFPGGNVEFLETRKQTIIREVLEETGLKIRKLKELNTIDVTLKKEKKHFIVICYKAESPTDKIKLSKEHDAYEWVKKFPSKKMSPLIKRFKLNFFDSKNL